MQENTNKAIIINSIVNYVKMGITTIFALFTTRFSLQALGVVDFGLFAVLGSIMSFVMIFNMVMVNTCNRFLAVSIGKGDIDEINKTFNVNVIIFIGSAILLGIVALPIGFWYISSHLNYSGSLDNAYFVFTISAIGSIISILGTPFTGLLISKERFIIFSFIEVIKQFILLVISYVLISHFDNKLRIYAVANSLFTIFPFIVYWLYCNKYFPNIVKFKVVKDCHFYKQVFAFSGWVAYGAVACLAKSQGASLLVNNFFNTVMNTALGVANSLGNYVTMFANSMTQPIQPQITKSYAAGDFDRVNVLLVMSTKMSFMLMLVIGTPFIVGGEWILKLWLGTIPPYAVLFTKLLVIDNIVLSFNSGLSNLIFASGQIALYQVVINTIRFLSIIAGYWALKSGTPAHSLLLIYIIFSIIVVIATQWCLAKTLKFNNSILIKRSYFPSLLILIFMMPCYLLKFDIHPVGVIFFSVAYLILIEYFIGLNQQEKKYIQDRLKSFLVR